MELTNEQRICMGIEPIDPAWDIVDLPNTTIGYTASRKVTLYFDGNVIRKEILTDDGFYYETTLHDETSDNRTMLCPKTNKGKPRKLTVSNLEKNTPQGVYFLYSEGYITIANFTTQQTYYYSRFAGLAPMSENDVQKFLEQWILETDDAELERINAFANAKRKHCKFKEGDFFRYKIDRTHYGYGRILLDMERMRKRGEKFWDILMGKPLVVSVYHIITDDPNVGIQELKKLKSCPSQHIFDNVFFYGEYEIIGFEELPDDVDYPIMYGRSISAIDRNKIIFQRGHLYKEIPLEDNHLAEDNFRNGGVGWGLKANKNILMECIKENSNTPYWNLKTCCHDLRNPKFANEQAQILKQMDI